jgi:hypothetical protein
MEIYLGAALLTLVLVANWVWLKGNAHEGFLFAKATELDGRLGVRGGCSGFDVRGLRHYVEAFSMCECGTRARMYGRVPHIFGQ